MNFSRSSQLAAFSEAYNGAPSLPGVMTVFSQSIFISDRMLLILEQHFHQVTSIILQLLLRNHQRWRTYRLWVSFLNRGLYLNRSNVTLSDAGINDEKFSEIATSIDSLDAFSSLTMFDNKLTDASIPALSKIMIKHHATITNISSICMNLAMILNIFP